MRNILILIITAMLCIPASISCQTVFGGVIDTITVSGVDSCTVVRSSGVVLSVGDTASVWMWYVSSDSVDWRTFTDFDNWYVRGDSICIDTLPLHRYYIARCERLDGVGGMFNIVWRVGCIAYERLIIPYIWNDGYIDKDSVLLLRYDSMMFGYSFDGLQPDSVFFRRDGARTTMPARQKGVYDFIGYVYNRRGVIIDSAVSRSFSLDFVHPLEKLIFKSWRGSNDGRPRTVDTLVIDSCKLEYWLDTLVFAVGDPYRYEFVPVIARFDKMYNFSYKWEYENFAFVHQSDSVLVFDPIGFQHSGTYRFVTVLKSQSLTTYYHAAPIRIVAFNTWNDVINQRQDAVVTMGVVYDIWGRVVASGMNGLCWEVVRSISLPAGVYVLRDKNFSYKFIK